MARVKLLDPGDSKRRLDRYELIGEIASGGMATVFLARLAGVGGFQRFVAIKRLHPHLAGEEEFVEMFLDEARLAAGIHHPHVVPILEVGTSDSGYYLVMEYVEGDTLARIVARAVTNGDRVPRAILVRIVLDSLAGLHAAHELTDDRGVLVGLVHRDVSPQNLLVGVDGTSRITDFGVARSVARLSQTRAGKLKGKLAYMSPEQTKGDELDRRADLFSMGVILWEVLASRRLFKAETEAATISRVLLEPIKPPSAYDQSLPKVFDEVALKALDRDPLKRFKTAADMADALERAARTAATSSATDVGAASPREVASYVQKVIGQEIAAQRESVRAWLAQSEPSQVSAREVTVKIALDADSGRASSPPSSKTKVGIGVPLAPAEPVPSSRTPPMPFGIQPPKDVRVHEAPPAPPAPPEPDEMDLDSATHRIDATSLAASMTVAQPGSSGPVSSPISVPQPPMVKPKTGLITAVVGVVVLLGAAIAWSSMRGGPAPIPASGDPGSPASSRTSSPTPSPPAPSEVPSVIPPPVVPPTAESSAREPGSAEPKSKTPKGSGGGKRPPSGKTAPPASTGEDLSNPYR